MFLTARQENSDLSKLNDSVLGMELFPELLKNRASPNKFCRHVRDIDLIYTQDFLFETITRLTLVKDKKYPE